MDEIYDAIVQYPKSEKFALGADTKNSFMRFYRLIIAASKKYYKKIPGFHCGMDSMMRKASLSKLADTLFTTCALITFPFGSMVNSIVT